MNVAAHRTPAPHGSPAAAEPLGRAGGIAAEFHDVSVRFSSKKRDVPALRNVSLEVEHGEFVSIVGPSGCGKSTLLKLLAGLLRPTGGRVVLRRQPVVGPRSDIGYVFQRAALLEWRTARRNILLQAEMRRMDSVQAARRADELIEMVGLTGFQDALPHELSGGMQQRVALCRALLHNPSVLLMDEPFGALDALTREQMNVELHRVWRETGTTVLLVTHSIAEAVYLSDRVAVMTARPGTVAAQITVNLPAERDYAATMTDPQFTSAAGRIRELLGAGSHAE